MPAKVYDEIKGDLSRFGARVIDEFKAYGENAEANVPRVEVIFYFPLSLWLNQAPFYWEDSEHWTPF